MKLGLSADELLTTTRAVRKRLDFDKPVEPEVIKECLEAALQSPTGSNRQGWQWMVVTDAEKRAGLADLYRKGWDIYASTRSNAATAPSGADPKRVAQQRRVVSSAAYLAEHFEKVPVMMIPILPGRLDDPSAMAATSTLGSILPGAWSFMLAARERGLGTAWTTIHLMFEQQAAELLGIDYRNFTQCALITCGYTKGTDFKPAQRPPLETVLHWDTWGGAAPSDSGS
jgi:nitroreductase